MRKAISGIALALLLLGTLTLAFIAQPARAQETIYIRADGSIDPSTANITSVDMITYTFTDNNYDQIVIQRSNIVVDGDGYTLQGSGIQDSEGIDLTSRSNVTVKNTRIEGFWTAIHLDYSSSNNVTGNDIMSIGKYGICLWSSTGNSISRNNITNHAPKEDINCGIYLGDASTDNDVSGNNITASNWGGVYIDGVSSNRFFGNIFVGDGLVIGYMPQWDNVVENNLVNGKPLVYLEDASNLVVEDAGQVILVNCTDITVRNLNLSYTSVGVELWKSSNSTVTNNTITTTSMLGIFLWSSSSNNVSGNKVSNNLYYGIQLWYSSNNRLYQNNIVNNAIQALAGPSGYSNLWDDGYPSGGNYWSDYTGADMFRGAHQNETGSDGIGDTPYIIDLESEDSYPLTKPYPWASHDIGVTALTASKTVVGQGYDLSINGMLFNYGNETENFDVTVYTNATVLATLTSTTLTSRSSTTISFTWNTTGFAKGKYTTNAYAWPVPGETDAADNTKYSDVEVRVTIPGDVDGDFDVDIFDVVQITSRYGKIVPPVPPDSNADIDGNGVINIFDVVICTGHYGQKWP